MRDTVRCARARAKAFRVADLLALAIWASGWSLASAVVLRPEPARNSSARDASAVDTEPDCFECDLNGVLVPPEIAWLPRDDPFFFSEHPEFDVQSHFHSYWNRLQAAAEARGQRSAMTLHEQCNVDMHGCDFLAKSLDRKRRQQSLGMVSAKPPFHPGLFVVFRGDSFMRITMIAVLRMMTDDEEILRKSAFDIKFYHEDHLLCCRGQRCTFDYGNYDYEAAQLKAHVRIKLDEGQTCILWQLRNTFDQDYGYLQWLLGGGGESIAPDLLVVNGGLHYSNWGHNTQTQLATAVESYVTEMRQAQLNSTTLMFVSSTYNSYYAWPPQQLFYEKMRQLVADLPPELKRQVSYVDLHTLAGVDSCGFSSNFPHGWYSEAHDQCGNDYVNADIHLWGGLYMHLADLVTFTLYQGKRRCDPGPFRPVDMKRVLARDNTSVIISNFIGKSLKSKASPKGETLGIEEYMNPDPNKYR